MSKILFIGAHYDDIELSCGGTIAKMLEQGHIVSYLGLSDCGNKLLEDECLAACKVLGIIQIQLLHFPVRNFPERRQDILEKLIELRNLFVPGIIFTHSAYDRHQDHAVVGQESLRAFREQTVLSYANRWNIVDSRQDNLYYQLTPEQVKIKIEAVDCYKSQLSRKNMQLIETTSRVTGNIVGLNYAESFHIERMIE